jgi:hypothetical protein
MGSYLGPLSRTSHDGAFWKSIVCALGGKPLEISDGDLISSISGGAKSPFLQQLLVQGADPSVTNEKSRRSRAVALVNELTDQGVEYNEAFSRVSKSYPHLFKA